jgi:hypothetical protein
MMIRPTLFFALLIAFVACNSEHRNVTPTTPTLPSQPQPVPPGTSGIVITVGQEVRATFIGNPGIYQLTAPSDGTLVTRLTFDPTVENGAKLKLTIGECATPQPNTSCPSAKSFQGSEPNWSPVVGRVAVSAGRTYRVIVEEGLSPWDYHFNQPFELIAAVE